mgnify:CR=1 FL=1|tara:strand:- start:512 stop:1756 length:1245 start_codon:yes stop_codon:yes gene_type:complete
MTDILSTNPELGDVLRRAVDRVGQNHAKARDNQGVVLSNEGETHQYDSTKGVHPSRIGQQSTKGTEIYSDNGSMKVLGEEKEKEVEEMEKEEEMDEATSAGAAGSYVGPLFSDMKEDDEEAEKIMESVIKEKVSDILVLEDKIERMIEDELDEMEEIDETGSYAGGVGYTEKEPAYNFKSQGPFQGRMTGPGYNFQSDGPLNEIKERIVQKLKEDAYLSGKLKYEKPKTTGGFKKGTPGIEVTDQTFKTEKKDSKDYYDMVDKKMKDYLDIKYNTNPEFPHQNMSKTDYESPMYRNTEDDENFIDDFRGMGLQDANGVENLTRLSDYLSGSQETGNAQTDKDGNPLANVVPSKLGEKMKNRITKKKETIAKRKAKMSNLKGITPDVQTVKVVSENVEKDMDKIKHLFNYNQKTQ